MRRRQEAEKGQLWLLRQVGRLADASFEDIRQKLEEGAPLCAPASALPAAATTGFTPET